MQVCAWLLMLLLGGAAGFSATEDGAIDPVATRCEHALGCETAAAAQGIDGELADWRGGRTLSAKTRLFQVDYVRQQAADTIAFEGKSFGQEGRIALSFYTQDGDLVHTPKSGVYTPYVNAERRTFVVSGIIPPRLRGRTGMVEVSFVGRERASLYFAVRF